MKWDKLRKYAEIFQFERDSRLDVYAVVGEWDNIIGECWSKNFGTYSADLLIFDNDLMAPSCKFLISHERMGCIEISIENESIAKDFLIADCNTFVFV